MSYRRNIPLIVQIATIMILLLGCSQSRDYEPLSEGIKYRSYSRDEFLWTENGIDHSWALTHEQSWTDVSLQKQLDKKIGRDPIISEEQLTAYAWDALPILIDNGYLPKDWVPLMACQYSTKVWCISYGEPDNQNNYIYDGTKDIYISPDDGHVIFFWNGG